MSRDGEVIRLGVAAVLGEADQAPHLLLHEQHQRVLTAPRAGLDEATFAEAWARGRALSPADITALVAEFASARE